MRRIAAWNSKKCPDAVSMTLVAVAAIASAVIVPAAQETGVSALIRMEMVRVAPAPPPAAARNPDGSPNVAALLAQMGDMAAKMIAPEGKVEMRWMARAGVARTELLNPMLMMPTGTILLTKGSTVMVLNPVEHTYYETPAGGRRMPGVQPGAEGSKQEVTVTPTGKTGTLLGHRVERVDIVVRIPLPSRSASTPPGVPTDTTMTLESWETSELGAIDPALVVSFQGFLAAAGMDKAVRPGHFPLKSIARLSMMPGYEIRTTVLEVAQKPLEAGLFEVPAGFKKIDPPRPRLP